MIVVPDPAQLDAFPTDPTLGGPYVMWKGTPYAHLMVRRPGTECVAGDAYSLSVTRRGRSTDQQTPP